MTPYQILEIANTHGGSLEYVLALLDEFKEYEGYGMKFQPLHPDKIATPDFTWYKVYQQLLFTEQQWRNIFDVAGQTKEIWLDLFDTYGTTIFEKNKAAVRGLKLQPSVLYNQSVLNELERITLEGKILIINISGLQIADIQERLKVFEEKLKPSDIWMEVGFQAYPTELQDSGYVKIQAIKQAFNRKVVFADHAGATTEDAIWLPVFAAMQGADIIEKHICHSQLETKYDHFSSIKKHQYDDYIKKLTAYVSLKEQPFINAREQKYLSTSIQIPITKHTIAAGSLVNYSSDLEYKRSGLSGLNVAELKKLQDSMHIVGRDIAPSVPLKKTDFKKANIATVIACRLKSSRLPKKALLKIGSLPSVERCIQSCMNFSNVNNTVLATSDIEDDRELQHYTYAPQVIFHVGDPDDVIKRYLGIADRLNIDVIVRVTADMPFVSEEIVALLLKSHFETGADYTAARHAAVGSSAEIMNVSSLRKIKQHFKSANYSEYMTWYFQNNPEHFKLNLVDLPQNLVRDYRLTLDYQEDLDMFNAVQKYLDENKLTGTIQEIFQFLDQNPEVAALNSHLTLKYKTDRSLIEELNKQTKIKTGA